MWNMVLREHDEQRPTLRRICVSNYVHSRHPQNATNEKTRRRQIVANENYKGPGLGFGPFRREWVGPEQ